MAASPLRRGRSVAGERGRDEGVSGRGGYVVAVTWGWVDVAAGGNVIFWMSARLGGTDTTAKLVRAAAKWLVPGLISSADIAR